ncbi:MAG: glycosyltransferase [Alphaproteobacteria bacterium]|nr:glycosyltransferase [Alphaproteobacteria bacterium]
MPTLSKTAQTLKPQPAPLYDQMLASRILLVSIHCPTRAHAGGLRILDIYRLLKSHNPQLKVDLYTQKKTAIDHDYTAANEIFDTIYDSGDRSFSYATFLHLVPNPRLYDIIDFQFSIAPQDMAFFRAHASKLLFTPMECLSRDYALRSASLDTAARNALAKQAAEEQELCRRADTVVCVSKPDAAYLKQHFEPNKILAVETGVSDIEFGNPTALSARSKKPRSVLYLAYFGSPTNVEALQWYLDNVHPRVKEHVPDYRFIVVGRGDISRFASFAGTNVTFVGGVADVGPMIAEAEIGIAPALSGTGYRGKINQYAALAVPTVASKLAAESFRYIHGQDIFVADNAEDFASSIIDLLQDDCKRMAMGHAAQTKCLQYYSWTSRLRDLARAYSRDDLYPTVHAIVPSYRHARYLHDRIASIAEQTYPKIDLTVIDDCSPDDSDAVLQDLQKDYDFTYIRREINSGTPFSSWEYAACHFQNGLIWVCESDDKAELNFLEHGTKAFREHNNLALFYCNSWTIDDANIRRGSTADYLSQQWNTDRWEKPFIAKGEQELASYQIKGMTVPNMSSALMSADAFARAFHGNIKRYKLAGDWLFIGELMCYGDVAFIPDHLNLFRSHVATARSATQLSRRIAEYFIVKFCLHKRARKSLPQLWETLFPECASLLRPEASFSQTGKAMLKISLWDTVRLIPLLACSILAYSPYYVSTIIKEISLKYKKTPKLILDRPSPVLQNEVPQSKKQRSAICHAIRMLERAKKTLEILYTSDGDRHHIKTLKQIDAALSELNQALESGRAHAISKTAVANE